MRAGAMAALVSVLVNAAAGAARAQETAPRTVLVIHWGSEQFPGTAEVDGAIRAAVLARPDIPVNYFAEYFESEEFPFETAATALRDSIRVKFQGRRIDVVIANASGALQFATRFREELFPGAPIVFIAVATPQGVADGTAPHLTGVVRDTAFAETLELALRLQPFANQCFVIAQAPTVPGYQDRIRAALAPIANRVKLTYVTEPTTDGLLTAVRAIPPRSVVLYTRYAPQDPIRITYTDEIAAQVAAASPVPVFVTSEIHLGSGVVGGMTRALGDAGTRVGEIALEILAGRAVQDIPVERLAVVPAFDWRQLRNWGIEESQLPAGSLVQFRTPTLWEAYRGYVVGTVAIVTAQLVLIAGLLTQIARRKRAEATIRTRESSLRTSYQRIRQLAGRLIHAQEEARAGIAKDLHDDICQRLASVSMSVDTLKRASGQIQDARSQEAFADLAREAHGAFDGIRRLSHELHPATLRVLGLAPALKAHCAEVAKRQKVEIGFTSDGDLQHIQANVAVCLFRIAQEAIRNGIAHGGARRLSVSLARSDAGAEMTVTDDGQGFDLDAVRRSGDGLGIVSIEERAHVIGGSVEILSRAQQGTTIRVRVSATGGELDAPAVSR